MLDCVRLRRVLQQMSGKNAPGQCMVKKMHWQNAKLMQKKWMGRDLQLMQFRYHNICPDSVRHYNMLILLEFR